MTEETSAEGLRKNRVPMAANTTRTNIVEVTGETASLLALRSKNEAIFIVTREDDNVKIVIPRAKSRPREPGWWRATRTFTTSKGAKIKANDMCNRIRSGSSSVSPLALKEHEVHGDSEHRDEDVADGTMDAHPQAAVSIGAPPICQHNPDVQSSQRHKERTGYHTQEGAHLRDLRMGVAAVLLTWTHCFYSKTKVAGDLRFPIELAT
jgi:hypothetical protein